MNFRNILGLLLITSSLKAQFVTGNFATKVDFAVGSNPQGITVGDLNNDGKSDIIIANISSNTLTILVNTTSSPGISVNSFSNSISLSCASAGPTNVSIADFNNDGKKDIAVGYSGSISSFISVFTNNFSSGTLSSSNFTRTEFSTGTVPAGIATGDIDGDGKTDIVTANYSSNNITLLRNTSIGSTLSFAASTHTTASGPNSVAVGDLDKDGKSDIVTANWGANSLTVFKNNSTIGSINLLLLNSINSVATQSNPNWLNIVDLNNDTINDVLVSNYSSNSFSVFRSMQSNGIAFQARIDFPQSPSQFTQSTFAQDLDFDGKQDIGVVSASNTNLRIYKNIYQSGTFNSGFLSASLSLSTNNSPVGTKSIDLDGDFRPDIIVGNYSSNNVSIFRNQILFPEPTVNASNVTISKNITSANFSFTKGNGTKRIVVLRADSQVSILPMDENWYTANDTFGKGTHLGNGNYLVYADTGSNFTIQNIDPNKNYFYSIVEYNGVWGYSNYRTLNPTSGLFFTRNIYYDKSTGPLDSLSSWGTNPDGSGQNPTSFNQNYTQYIVKNNPSPFISGNLFLTGVGTYLVFGNDTTNFNFSIAQNQIFGVDSISVLSNITITMLGNIYSNKAFFADNSTVQYISSNNQNILPFNYFNLVSAFSAKTLDGNTKVRGTLSLLSNINTSNYTLSLGNSASQLGTLVRSNAYIIGTFSRWYNSSITAGNSGLFPIGTSGFYRPIQLDYTSAPSSAGQITAQFIEGNPGNTGLPVFDFSNVPIVNVNKAAINGVWRLTNSGITGGTFNLSCTGNGFFGINNVSEIRLIRRTVNGSWTTNGSAGTNSGTNTSPVVVRTGMNQYGEITFGGDITNNPLPVDLIEFNGKNEDGSNLITWTTATEINNKEFKLFRKSNSNEEWKEIYQIDGKISSSTKLKYNFQDKNIESNKSYYYQLSQQDIDGKETKSKIIFVENINSNAGHISVFPIPANESINLSSEIDQKIQIFNQINLIEEFDLKANNTLEFSTIELTPGLYIIKNCNSTGCFSKTFIVHH